MAHPVKDSFLDLERHRQLLEDNIEKLRKSLRHWQLWEAEYEGLKEEILAAESTPSRAELLEIGQQYEGELVTRKEVNDILGVSTPRDAAQVVNVLDRRMDYVEQNIKTLMRQIESAETKLAAATVISAPDIRNEEGLPLTEITEELDEDGTVIKSHISTPGSAKPQLLEVLQKAGVKDIPNYQDSSSWKAPRNSTTNVEEIMQQTTSTKKGVSFAEDPAPGLEQEKSRTAKRIEQIMKLAKEQEIPPTEPPVIPTTESAEDAALRRDMLQYGMSEIGAVVAELDLEEGSEWSDEDYDSETSDEEDSFGRSTGRYVDDELRQRMIELEERLGARVMENIGKKASDYEVFKEGIGRVTINNKEDDKPAESAVDHEQRSDKKSHPESSAKKSVRFAGELDISPVPKPALSSSPLVATRSVAPISDIVERSGPNQSDAVTSRKRDSKFKAARAGTRSIVNGPFASTTPSPTLSLHPSKPSSPNPFSAIHFAPVEDLSRTVPSGPEGRTLAAKVVERDLPVDASAVEPDEMDPHLLHQEVATEYHKMRNMMIQRQGGFMKEEESEIVPFTEEEGGPKKLSRFKAARLAKS